MLKKRGKYRAYSILGLGLIIALVFIIFFINQKNTSSKETYNLTDDEAYLFDEKVSVYLADQYPDCNAFLKRDMSYCEFAKDKEGKDDCQVYLGILKSQSEKNVSYCEKIEDATNKEICEMLFNKNIDCDEVSEENKYICLAVINNDLSYCDNYKDIEFIESCTNGAGFLLSSLQDDIEGCKSLPDQWTKDFCLAWTTGKEESCAREGVEVDKTEILIDLAKETKNEKICYTIEKTKDRETCFLELATKKDDAEICDKIKNKEYKKACESIFSFDMEMCDKVNDNIARTYCKTQIGYEI